MPSQRVKRVRRFLRWFVLILLFFVAACPIWFPWLLRPAAKRFGATFQTYERRGFIGLAATGVLYTNRNVTVRADRIEVEPWRRRAKIENWAVIVLPSEHSSSPSEPPSVHRVYQNVFKIVTNVQRWVIQGSLTNGIVRVPNVTIGIPTVQWRRPSLAGQVQISNALPLTVVAADLPAGGLVHIELSNPTMALKSSLTSSNTPEGLFIHTENTWRTNHVQFNATFGTEGALPEAATLHANSLVYPPFQGDLSATWQPDHYAFALQAAVQQQPISFRLQATGQTNFVQIETVDISAPWIQAGLTGQIVIDPALRSAELALAGDNVRSGQISASRVSLMGSLFRSNFVHAGSIFFQNLRAPGLNPLEGGVNWLGEKLDFQHVNAAAAAAGSAILLEGAADIPAKHVQVNQLSLGTNRLDFAADVRWPEAASLCLLLTNLPSEVIGGFFAVPPPEAVLNHLQILAQWNRGPLTGDLQFNAGTRVDDGTKVAADGSLALRHQGLFITNVAVMRNGEPVATIDGSVPVRVDVTQKPIATPVPGDAIQVQATAHRDAFFWKILENRFGLFLGEPDLRGYVSGTWEKPAGRISMRAATARSRRAAPEIPPLENLALMAHIRKDAAELEFLSFFITNQPVTVSALIPLPTNFWSAPHSNVTNLDWRNLSCRLKIDNAQIAGFVPLLSGLIAPQGIVDADVGILPGGKLDGQFRIDGAATRPIGSVGALQDIEILCRLSGDKAHINSHVSIGGSPLLGAGDVQLDAAQLARDDLPPFEFSFTGENVPLARQPDAIVRADVDVKIKHASNQPALVAGKLNLRHSLYLRELRELAPGRLASVDRRPPYFSVSTKPFSDWRVDLHAAGARFLKVRTPIFNGEVSADLRLSGTLGNPTAIGDVTVDQGMVRFPFGIIPISQGIVSLTSDNPYRPQLALHGNDRVLGYDIIMEVTGYADAPVIQFSSTPPLNSDQILIMLTAGEIPRQGQFAFTTEQRAQRVGLFLGRSILSDLGIGGDSNRLTVRSGENVTETGHPTYSVEYELTRDWSVIGQYDQFNDFNLMLRWRVYAR